MFNTLIDQGKVEVNRGTSEDVAQNFPDEYFYWVYIDGNHLYEYVKKPTNKLEQSKSWWLIGW